MLTSCRNRSSQGRPGAWEKLITTCCALSACRSVSDPISDTTARTPLAPSDTEKTAMISQISSLRAGPGNGCGSAQSDGQETAWLGEERTDITALHGPLPGGCQAAHSQ